jgi:hypothetical protein
MTKMNWSKVRRWSEPPINITKEKDYIETRLREERARKKAKGQPRVEWSNMPFAGHWGRK